MVIVCFLNVTYHENYGKVRMLDFTKSSYPNIRVKKVVRNKLVYKTRIIFQHVKTWTNENLSSFNFSWQGRIWFQQLKIKSESKLKPNMLGFYMVFVRSRSHLGWTDWSSGQKSWLNEWFLYWHVRTLARIPPIKSTMAPF